MATQSAGIVLYRRRDNMVEVLLAHPGGPFYAKKDDGVWSMPKGELEASEPALEAAKREFREEMGEPLPAGEPASVGATKLKSGKIIHAWALEADFDTGSLRCNTFTMEWPPRSGKQQVFPENDRAAWFPLAVAQQKITPGQLPVLAALAQLLGVAAPGQPGQSSLF